MSGPPTTFGFVPMVTFGYEDDLITLGVGDLVEHRIHGWKGYITGIYAPVRGAGVLHVKVYPASEPDYQTALTRSTGWPVAVSDAYPDGRYIEPRDGGQPVRFWNLIKEGPR